MFKVEESKKIKWPVVVSIPRDGGEVTKATFTGEFKVIPTAEFNAIYDNGGNDGDMIRNVMTGWGNDVSDSEGNAMEFSPENLDKLIAIPYVRTAMVAAYMDLSHGNKAKRKN